MTDTWLPGGCGIILLLSCLRTQGIVQEASNDIEKDITRTYPNTKRFAEADGQNSLRNVLRAYAAYDPEVGYCQGMNFITGLLLMFMPSEAHAFAGLVLLMEDRGLRKYYHRSLSLLQVRRPACGEPGMKLRVASLQ